MRYCQTGDETYYAYNLLRINPKRAHLEARADKAKGLCANLLNPKSADLYFIGLKIGAFHLQPCIRKSVG